jgi:hypothetical protein
MDNLKQQWQSDEDARTIEYIVHKIRMGDVEDPDIMVAQPIYEWQQTEAGKYIMKNSAPEPMWLRSWDHPTYGYMYTIKAYFTPKQLTYYKLRFE